MQISKLSGMVLTICGVYILSPASGTRNEVQTTLVSRSPVDNVRIEESGEKIVAKDSSADVEAIPSARSRNTGVNSDELAARDLFQECVCVSPSGVAFSI